MKDDISKMKPKKYILKLEKSFRPNKAQNWVESRPWEHRISTGALREHCVITRPHYK